MLWHPHQAGLVHGKNFRSTQANIQEEISANIYEVAVLDFHKFQNVCSSWDLESLVVRGLDPSLALWEAGRNLRSEA